MKLLHVSPIYKSRRVLAVGSLDQIDILGQAETTTTRLAIRLGSGYTLEVSETESELLRAVIGFRLFRIAQWRRRTGAKLPEFPGRATRANAGKSRGLVHGQTEGAGPDPCMGGCG